MHDVTNLDQYLGRYGALLAQRMEDTCRPLHRPGIDPVVDTSNLLRSPYPAQAHAATGAVRTLEDKRGVIIAAACGAGKTLLSQAISQCHASGPYRAVVMCPPHLVEKWEREIKETVRNPIVRQVRTYADMVNCHRHARPFGRTWWIVSHTRAKMGAKWRPAYLWGKRWGHVLRCPDCFEPIKLLKKLPGMVAKGEVPATHEDLAKEQMWCEHCEGALWTHTHEIDRWPIARYIHKKLKGFFHYCVVDECFPGDALVATPNGDRRIDRMLPGDRVWSMKHGHRVSSTVTRVIVKRRTQRLLRIVHSAGVLECTPGHKIWVNGRYVPAADLTPGMRLTINVDPLPHLRNDVRSQAVLEGPSSANVQPIVRRQMEVADQTGELRGRVQFTSARREAVRVLRRDVSRRLGSSQSPAVLWEEVFDQSAVAVAELSLAATGAIGHDSQQGGGYVLRANVAAQRDTGVQGASSRAEPEPEGADLCRHSRWQWPTDAAATVAGGGIESTDRAFDRDRCCELEGRGSGHRRPGADDRNRVRRGFAPYGEAEEPRSPQGGYAQGEGMGGAAFLECGDRQRSDAVRGVHPSLSEATVTEVLESDRIDELVYDLEVEETHCYFANGVLVSNCHQTKSADTAIGQATASLVAASKKTLFLTGTLMGGYAWHIRPAIFRLAPQILIQQGLTWEGEMDFNERYGRIERRVTELEKHGGTDNRQSKGKKTTTSKYVRPGIMPTLFAQVLCEHTIFLGLEELSDALPPLVERCIESELDIEQRTAYDEVEQALTEAVQAMLQRKDKRLLAVMLQTLLGYVDKPQGWDEIGYYDEDVYIPVIKPADLRTDVVRPKERDLIDWILAGRRDQRQSWVYCQMTDKRDVQPRLKLLLEQEGLRVGILRASIGTDKREAWIREHGPQYDVMLSHPQLVETGLDLFDKRGSYNFNRLAFYQCGYNLFTMRQASRRAWRLSQILPCEVAYFYYANTMQARAMTLMGKKLQAAQLIEGCFSTEGLAALGGEDDSLDIALAKSLVNRLDDLDVGRTWSKLAALTVGAA